MNCALGKVMEMARSYGFRVLQDGSGLDEAFAGYRNHHSLYVGLLLRDSDSRAEDAVQEFAINWGVDEATAVAAAKAELSGRVTTIDGTQPTRRDILDPCVIERAADYAPPLPSSADSLRVSLADYLQVSKLPRNTRMKDRMAMAYGLELRLPFLDHRLIEFALSLPPAHFFLHGRSKSIVRESLAGAMDEEVRLAVKRSIQAPQGIWLMQEPMRSRVQEILDSESFADRGLFDVLAAKKAFGEFCEGAYNNSFFVWQWINAEMWHRAFIDGDPVDEPTPLCPQLWEQERPHRAAVH